MRGKYQMSCGIITMHNVCNYGALLQTYALLKYVQKIEKECVLINYVPEVRRGVRAIFPPENIGFFREKASWIRWMFSRITIRKPFKEFWKKNYPLTGCYYSETIDSIKEVFDCYITGSDQVWNPDSTRGIDRVYFLDFVKNDSARIISYAASISKKEFNETEKAVIKKYLLKFQYISLREKNMIASLAFIDKKIAQCIDPTVLVGKQFWEDFVKNTNNPIIDGGYEYCLIYILGKDKNAIRYAKKEALKKGLKTVQIGIGVFNFQNADYYLHAITPEQFVRLFFDAKYIITNSLHGMLFSLLSENCFAIPNNIKEGIRFLDVIQTYGLQSFGNIDLGYSMTAFNPDYDKLNLHINQLRQCSSEYLANALSGK